MINENVEASRCMDVDLGDRAIEEVLQRATGLIFSIEIE
jgi:hypothetical protein